MASKQPELNKWFCSEGIKRKFTLYLARKPHVFTSITKVKKMYEKEVTKRTMPAHASLCSACTQHTVAQEEYIETDIDTLPGMRASRFNRLHDPERVLHLHRVDELVQLAAPFQHCLSCFL
jgi:hypothetical protein